MKDVSEAAMMLLALVDSDLTRTRTELSPGVASLDVGGASEEGFSPWSSFIVNNQKLVSV
jgi:hypothetical protein